MIFVCQKLSINFLPFNDVKKYGFGPTGYDDYEKEKTNIQNYPTYKILFDGKIIGGITCCNAGDFYWLGGIYIIPSYQNLGIGAKAIAFIENEFPNATRWRLHTCTDYGTVSGILRENKIHVEHFTEYTENISCFFHNRKLTR